MSNHSTNEHDLEAGQASPFAILLAALLGIFVLALLCTGAVLFLRDGGDQAGLNATSTAIAEANATTLAQNARVTQTIAAMETEAARPTNTSTPTSEPTETSTPTETPAPTETEVVAEVDETPTPNLFGTSIFAGEDTPTPIAGGSTGGGTLPDTGIGLGAALAIAVGLLFLVFVARRLRMG